MIREKEDQDFYREQLTEKTYIVKADNALLYMKGKHSASEFSIPEANKLVRNFFPDAKKDENLDIWTFSKEPLSALKRTNMTDKRMIMEIHLEDALSWD